jgi:hypothetical protein
VAVVVVVFVSVVLFLAVVTASVVLVLVAYPRLKEDGVWTESDEQRLAWLADHVPGRGILGDRTTEDGRGDEDVLTSATDPETTPDGLVAQASSAEQDTSATADLAGLLAGGGSVEDPTSPR